VVLPADQDPALSLDPSEEALGKPALHVAAKPSPISADFSPTALQSRSAYAADRLIGSRIEESSFSGLLTRVEIGHIRIGSAGNGRIKSCGSELIA
jgi:hypothetical protein